MVNRFWKAAGFTASLFLLVVLVVTTHNSLRFDEAVLRTLNGWSTPFADRFFEVFTHIGDPRAGFVIAAILVLFLAIKQRYRDGMAIGIALIGANIIGSLLKLVFERQRPELWQQLIHESSFSFPSGHAIASVAISLSIIYIIREWKYKRYIAIVLSLYILLIGLSRLYLGVHYPTDILGGWLISSTWCLLVFGWFGRRQVATDQSSK